MTYNYISRYEANIAGKPYPFYTLIFNGTLAWMPDSEQQHINLQYRSPTLHQLNYSDLNLDKLSDAQIGRLGLILQEPEGVPINPGNVQLEDVIAMIQQMYLFKTKKRISLLEIKKENRELAGQMLNDINSHELSIIKH